MQKGDLVKVEVAPVFEILNIGDEGTVDVNVKPRECRITIEDLCRFCDTLKGSGYDIRRINVHEYQSYRTYRIGGFEYNDVYIEFLNETG